VPHVSRVESARLGFHDWKGGAQPPREPLSCLIAIG